MKIKTFALFLFPVVLLAAVIALFLATDGAGLNVEPAAPIESLVFERTVLKPGSIELHVRNTSPQAVEIAQAAVKDMIVPFAAKPGRTVPRLGKAVVTIAYPWVHAEAYEVRLITANSVAFAAPIEAAATTRTVGGGSFLAFTLIGLYVGVIPVFLGIFWFPALRKLGRRAFIWLMALTVGLLLFLGIDAVNEALEVARELGSPFQGVGLVGIGIVGAFLLLDALAKRQSEEGGNEDGRRRRVAVMISLGIGLHNLGEGLAIGSAFSVGAAALGTFFVIGFILQNITEGLGIIAPIVKQRPSLRFLAGVGALGGAPAIAGAWIGGFAASPVLSVLFLAVGAGAVFEVAYEIGKLVKKGDGKEQMPLTVWSGVMAGMLLMYATGLLVK
ncbi:MAG: hypothetical protein WCT14_21195 [Treponemataceae bacterium]